MKAASTDQKSSISIKFIESIKDAERGQYYDRNELFPTQESDSDTI